MLNSTEGGSEVKFHYLMGLLLFVAGLLVLLVFVSLRSRADSDLSNTSATISNSAPVINTLVVNGGSNIDLTQNANTNVDVTGTYTDLNGCDTVDDGGGGGGVAIRLYRSGVSGGENCAADDLNCYDVSGAGCSLAGCSAGGADQTGSFSCTFSLAFYADGTDDNSAYTGNTWVASATTTDAEGLTDNEKNATQEVNTLTAVALSGDIAYGTLAIGSDPSAQQGVTVTNQGNDADVDLALGGTWMPCDIAGNIPGWQQHWSLNTGFEWADGSVLASSTQAATVSFNLNKSQDGAASSDDVYFRLKIPNPPTSTMRGSCSGVNTFAAGHSL